MIGNEQLYIKEIKDIELFFKMNRREILQNDKINLVRKSMVMLILFCPGPGKKILKLLTESIN